MPLFLLLSSFFSAAFALALVDEDDGFSAGASPMFSFGAPEDDDDPPTAVNVATLFEFAPSHLRPTLLLG